MKKIILFTMVVLILTFSSKVAYAATLFDFDGDGRADIAVFRPSNGTWYLQRSKEGFAAHVFGFEDDIPIPNVYVR